MPFRIIKQFIPTGQTSDPPWAQRRVYVWRVTSGSYSGSDETYEDYESGYYAINQLERDDIENFQGWGVIGDGRVYGLIGEISGTYPPPTQDELRDAKLLSYWRDLNPTITSFFPLTASQDQWMDISGSDFAGTAKVGFGWRKTKDFTIKSNELITVKVPTGAETGFLTVYNYNQEFDKADGFLTVSGTSIVLSSFTGGSRETGSYYTPVEIYGDNLQYTKVVRVGDEIVPRNTWILDSNNQITFYVPPDAVTAPIKLTNFENTTIETNRDFCVEPSASTNIQAFYPSYVPTGDILKIFGSHFLGVNAVAIHNTTGSFTIIDDNRIQLVVPEGAQTGKVRVQTTQSQVISSDEDVIWMPGVSAKKPVLDDFNPKTGSVGEIISVTGSQLLGTIGGYIVDTGSSFNPRDIDVIDRYHITFEIPAGSTSGYFWIRNNIGLKRSDIPIEIV